MKKKVLLVLVDGMRPESMAMTEHPFYQELVAHSYYTLKEQAVMPSVTLPCHMSLFHSVNADRHGILSNTYVPQVRPVNGICEVLKQQGKTSGLFFSWEELRDLSRPGSVAISEFFSGGVHTYEKANEVLTDRVIGLVKSGELPDFSFLYLGLVDMAGHKYGWMGKEYIEAVRSSIECIRRVAEILPEDHQLVVTADHGGHDRSHGADIPEDMVIPLFFWHKSFVSKEFDGDVSIIDIAPTIVSMLGAESDPDWEGKVLL
ncbi:MAG: alkaline phosphatase family protein [Lentisphaeria bacterium]|nr:alkaline phosphatase family protein [Lentisphaeria bacterium]